MRIQVDGAEVALGACVVELTGRVVAVQLVPPREEGKTGYYEIAVSQLTSVVGLQVYGPRGAAPLAPQLEVDEKYVFTCEVSNDSYSKASQAKFVYKSHRPYTKPPTVNVPQNGAPAGAGLGAGAPK